LMAAQLQNIFTKVLAKIYVIMYLLRI
jgi:hypothetical protein